MKHFVNSMLMLSTSISVLLAQSTENVGTIKGSINIGRGEILLEELNDNGHFDTIQIVRILPDSSFLLENIASGEYLLSFIPDQYDRDTIALRERRALPVTYFPGTLFWDKAEKVSIPYNAKIDSSIEIEMVVEPLGSSSATEELHTKNFVIEKYDSNEKSRLLFLHVLLDAEPRPFYDIHLENYNVNDTIGLAFLPGYYVVYRLSGTGVAYGELPNAFDFVTGDDFVEDLDFLIKVFPDRLDVNTIPLLTLNEDEFLIYPNPAFDILHVGGSSNHSISDLSGKEWKVIYLGIGVVDISHLPSGSYLIVDHQLMQTTKFLKR